MANYLQFDQLEEGVFYYVLGHYNEPENQFVWYKRDGRLKNPKCCSDTLNTSERYHYCPLTLDKVDEFDAWMEENGDCIGQITWTAYKMKLREAKMAKKDETKKSKEDVDLYDPKFVRFDWDESLKGKKGFYCDHIDGLKYRIRNNDVKGVCDWFGDSGYPFGIKNTSVFRFFYYDPNYEIKWAYFKEGKRVQFRGNYNDKWQDIPLASCKPEEFDDNFEYRIKPEEEQETAVKVNVDVKVNTSTNGKIKITINGKECIFENAEQARMVLKG